MDGHHYMIERNRLMHWFEEQSAGLRTLAEVERRVKMGKLQAEFDRRLAELYAQVAGEYPGERKKSARPISDPR